MLELPLEESDMPDGVEEWAVRPFCLGMLGYVVPMAVRENPIGLSSRLGPC